MTSGRSSGAEPFSVDPEEVARFTRFADTWWDPEGPFWPIHGLNRYRTAYLRQALAGAFGRDHRAEQPFEGLRLLDIGCGGGLLSEAMARLGADVHGIDATPRNIVVAEHHRDSQTDAPGNIALANLSYEHATVEALARLPQRYDIVLNMEVVEHVNEPGRFLEMCASLVSQRGVMAVATINRTLKSFATAIVGAEYVLRLLPRGTHQWRRFVTPQEVRGAMAQAGMTEFSGTGIHVNPFARSFRDCNSMAVNYMLAFRR